MTETEITVSSDGYCFLSFRKQKHRQYKAKETEDGIIVLVPAAMVPAVKLPTPPVTPKEDAWH
jgi:hypothetical protein